MVYNSTVLVLGNGSLRDESAPTDGTDEDVEVLSGQLLVDADGTVTNSGSLAANWMFQNLHLDAGKTVMAAAVFEALFYGDDRYAFERDRGAVVIWFSDDPSLNEQTRFRLMESSDRLRHTDLVVVENTFNRAKFDPGKIYLLNTQKLGKKSLLVRGFDADEDESVEAEPAAD